MNESVTGTKDKNGRAVCDIVSDSLRIVHRTETEVVVMVLLCKFWSGRCSRGRGLGVVVVVLWSFGCLRRGRCSFGGDVGVVTHFDRRGVMFGTSF